MFSAVFEDVAKEHGILFERLLESSKTLEIPDKLRHHFTEYILFFYRNPRIHYFSNQSLFHVPPELFERLRADYLKLEKPYRKRLEEIFIEGIKRGIVRQGDPVQKVWSFKAKRDGVLGWMRSSPELTEECVEEFWIDFWSGMKERSF